MAAEGSIAKPRILCLDGGGIRGLSEILILKELMLQVQLCNNLQFTPEPKQCFDLICGTSTGGLVAVLLGRLGKTLDECETLFRTFGSKIFSGGSASRATRLALTGSKHASEGLAEAIREQAGEEMMHENEANPHIPVSIPVRRANLLTTLAGKVANIECSIIQVAVVAISKTTGDDYLFRTYGIRARIENCSIVDACLATSAATTFFPSIKIDGVEYVDGGFGKNNPSEAALKELESDNWLSRMGDSVKEVGCFVSIGTGRPTFRLEKSTAKSKMVPKGITSLRDAANICVQIATDCHRVHLKVENRYVACDLLRLFLFLYWILS